jgi:FkbM family methyltransferase
MSALVPGDIISESIAVTGFYEQVLSQRLTYAARQGGLMVDVGANLGYFSVLWLASRAENRCISIEASPRNVPLLKQNIQANSMEQRCEIRECAAGRADEVMNFELGPESQSGWGGLTLGEGRGAVQVAVRRLDEIVPDDRMVDVLKVDVEGADTWVLLGAERLLRRRQIKTIFYEQNKPRMKDLGISETEAQQFLEAIGYRVNAMGDVSGEVVEYTASPS